MSITGSSKSATVKAANSKIAIMLRKREEDDALLTIGKRKTGDVAKNEIKIQAGRKGRGAFDQPADFSFPTPLIDRPSTDGGSQSFHFSFTTISKTATPTQGGKPLAGFSSKSAQRALDHSKYIERDGAAEISAGAEHAGYIERASAIESIDPPGIAEEAVERDIAPLAGEGLTPDEAAKVGPLDDAPVGIPSVFSNISDDPFEREEYWRAVYRSERNPKTHSIILDVDASPKWWAALDADSTLDPSFKAHVLQVKEARRQFLKNSLIRPQTKPFAAAPYSVSSERAGTILKQAMLLPGFNKNDMPTEFESGPGGRAQIRFVAELPHELSPEDRALIVQNFTDHLGSISNNEAGETVGLMFTAVVHAPDIHNDKRNFHLHIVAHDRPAKFMDEHGRWDFEIEERFLHKRQERVRHPHRQNKIGEVSQGTSKTGKANSGRDFIPALRIEFARITNLVLEARGVEKRYDPRRYTEMGIERDPTEHLGTKAAALEAAGVPTSVGKINAIKIWRAAEHAIERNAAAADAIFKKKQKEIADLAAAATAADPHNHALIQLRQHAAERQVLIDGLAEDRRLVETFDHLEAKAKSRAVRTRQTCIAFLIAINSGKAKPYTVSLRTAIEDRFLQAQARISEVDAALVNERADVVDLSRSIVERETRVAAIDRALEPVTVNLKTAVEIVRTRRLSVAPVVAQRPVVPVQPVPPTIAPTITLAPAAPVVVAAPNVATKLPGPPIPATERDAQPGATQAAPNVTSTPTEKDPNNGRSTSRATLARVGRLFLELHERSFGDAPSRAAASPISSLQKLSSIGMVHHHKSFAVLLRRDALDGLGRRGTAGDELRRAGTGNRQNAGGRDEAVASATATASKIVQLSPAAIEGAPIVAPSLPPRAKIEAEAETSPLPGLAPLRPPVVPTPASTPPETIIPDISKTAEENAAIRDAQRQPQTTASKPPSDAPVPTTAPTEPKIDGRRRVDTPTLFDVTEQLPPIKPGTPRQAYDDWEKLLGKIAEKRFLIVEAPNSAGGMTYTVPSLSNNERSLLNAERFAPRTNNRLGSIYGKQKLEIERVVRWIATKGQDPTALIITGRTAKLGVAPTSIKTLVDHWRGTEAVVTAIRNENARRIVEAARIVETTLPMPTVTGLGEMTAAQKQREAQATCPPPKVIETQLVKSFAEELRSLNPKLDKLENLADQIRLSYAAREDVMRYGPQFAEAYTYHLKGFAAREAEASRIPIGVGKGFGR